MLGEGMAPRQLVCSVGDEEQYRPAPQMGRNVTQEFEAGGIGPVQVLEDDEGGAVDAESAKNRRTSAKSAAWSVTAASVPLAKAAGGGGQTGSLRTSANRSSQGP